MKRLLIIEDDAMLNNLYKGLFEREGFNVAICSSGQEGFYAIHELKPDVVLLDLVLPGIGGTEILSKIRAQTAFRSLPVFVFTNAFLPDLVIQARESGATGIFNKATVHPRDLVATIKAAAEKRPLPSAPDSQSKAASNAEQTPDETTDPSKECAAVMAAMRQSVQNLAKVTDPSEQRRHVDDLFRKIRALAGLAKVGAGDAAGWLAFAMEALMKEIHDKPKFVSSSVVRTIAQAHDLLGVLIGKDVPANLTAPITVLAVDDDPISRKASTLALERAAIRVIGASGAELGHAIAAENPFDLILLDVNMPGMDGLELCTKLRALPTHRQTPVVFVTSLSDLETRAKSSVSGGNDLVGKPFIFMELTVKVLSHVLRRRLAAKPAAPAGGSFDTAPARR